MHLKFNDGNSGLLSTWGYLPVHNRKSAHLVLLPVFQLATYEIGSGSKFPRLWSSLRAHTPLSMPDPDLLAFHEELSLRLQGP